MAPIALGLNRPAERPYRGGAGILRFRGIRPSDASVDDPGADRMPEDFVASATEVFAGGGVGLTVLPDGTRLRDAFDAHPIDYFGEAHVAAFGADPMLLVKLLNTGERLFVHFHPSTEFARSTLDRVRGKTEAWIVVDTDEAGYAYLGFRRQVDEEELLDWFERQDVDAMLAAMNRIELAPGDTLYVPAGVPHSIGPGITLVELQQPVDLSILVEYDGFPGLDRRAALLGLEPGVAFSDLDREPLSEEPLARLASWRPVRTDGDAQLTALFPPDADALFRADRIEVDGAYLLPADFAVLVVTDGEGELGWAGQAIPLAPGQTILVPHGAGATVLRGALGVLRCRPPHPEAHSPSGGR
ncbi:class I mannose-6-phosphate isomerase [Planctomonas sp. JC2975]|nr:class I mannose-6-phosphate isomerase [Planctomonas sp. JC2975]